MFVDVGGEDVYMCTCVDRVSVECTCVSSCESLVRVNEGGFTFPESQKTRDPHLYVEVDRTHTTTV